MEYIIHNHLDSGYEKVSKKVTYFLKHSLGNLKNHSRKLKLEFWLDGDSLGVGNRKNRFYCGVMMRRPGQKDFYIRKESKSLNDLLNSCIGLVRRRLIADQAKIRRY